jgi:hypothetical protein
MSLQPNNNRASLLAGLRTGGVRSTSNTIPHTAAPGGSFQIPRFASGNYNGYDEESMDDGSDMLGQNLNLGPPRRQSMPMTAGAVDASMFQQQQLAQQQMMMRQAASQRGQNGYPSMDFQAQAQMQLQMQQMQMQMQMMAIQQQQQYQAQLAAVQQQSSRNNLTANRRMDQPLTAGPTQTSFAQRLRNEVGSGAKPVSDDPGPVPMTAALGGKFGSRSLPTGLNPNASAFVGRAGSDSDDPYSRPSVPATPLYGSTTVISGGTSLGGTAAPSASQATAQVTPSKSDTAISWRRGSTPAAVKPVPIRSLPIVTVQVASPITEDTPPTAGLFARSRPQPLRFSPPTALGELLIDRSSTEDPAVAHANAEGYSPSGSNPPSPGNSDSSQDDPSKRGYDGIGNGRPVAIPRANASSQQSHGGSPNSLPSNRMPSYPIRQPRGPPAGAEDLGQKNFASRIRRKAVGGLGSLVDRARERREGSEIAVY